MLQTDLSVILEYESSTVTFTTLDSEMVLDTNRDSEKYSNEIDKDHSYHSQHIGSFVNSDINDELEFNAN